MITNYKLTIAEQMLNLGVRPGGVLLVHASLRALGPVPGGAETVILGLLEALGPQGTLLMPALSYTVVGPKNPIFDVIQTRTCVGALPEYFRTRPGTLRSVHPTHSVAGVGRRVTELFADHPLSTTPCGPHSPFARLPQVGGQILFLGCGMRPNTCMHAVEEQVEPPYLYGDTVDYQIIVADGSLGRMRVRGHSFIGWLQRYERLAGLLSYPDLRHGSVLAAPCALVEAAAMVPAALAALRKDAFYFVESEAY
jgi:aminoglycoside 3-N-acetyltransferase